MSNEETTPEYLNAMLHSYDLKNVQYTVWPFTAHVNNFSSPKYTVI